MRRSELTPGPPLPDRWVFRGLLALVAWLPLPWGSNTDAARAVLGIAAGVLIVAALRIPNPQHAGHPLPRATRLALGLCAAWALWIALQLLPLPPALLAALSPGAAATHAAVAALPADALDTLSIRPAGTLEQLILTLDFIALFWLVVVLVRRNRERQRLVLWVVLLSGVAQALYGTLMTLSGLEYGFLAPKLTGVGVATGTFVNRNHLAGYLELALCAGIALVLADLKPSRSEGWRQKLVDLIDTLLSPRMRVRVMLAFLVIGLVMTRSRMGNAAFFATLPACAGLYILLRHRALFLRSMLFFASLMVVDFAIVTEQYGLPELVERFEQTDLEQEQRATVFRELAPVVGEYRLTGAGLGAFADAYAPHRSGRVRHYFDHAHNDHLEFLIEAGAPGYALLAALALLVAVHGVTVVARRRDPVACALGFVGPMAIACLALHGIADFNLQIPAVAATLVVLAAMTMSCSTRGRSRPAAGASRA